MNESKTQERSLVRISQHIAGFQSIETYLRLKPCSSATDEMISYKITDQSAADGSKREVIDIDIPADADPGLVYNIQNPDGKSSKYEFDKVFDSLSSQEDVFVIVAKDRIKDAIYRGINCSIFAYGQTGAGKTYSICGGKEYSDRGLIPRTISQIFSEVKPQKKNKVPETSLLGPQISSYKCQITFVEIYKDVMYDLLPPLEGNSEGKSSPGKQKTKADYILPVVQVLECPTDDGGPGQLVLKNINVYEAASEEEALSLYFLGMKNRNTASTSMNISSSRSHAIFTAIIETETIQNGKTVINRGKINLADLAGSERAYKKASSATQISESKAINLSLHYLEQVIVALRSTKQSGNGSKDSYVPYRNSVLTTLLRDSLGGNCRSCFLFTMSCEKEHIEETISTLRFAQRCGEIKLNVFANTEIDLRVQIKELSSKLKSAEKHAHALEEQKVKLHQELEHERHRRKRLIEPRLLTADDKYQCKVCVQNLLTAAKEALQRDVAASRKTEREDSVDEKQQLLEASQDRLYSAIEVMDKAVLVELSVALGGLVQTLYMERENTRQQLLEQIEERERDKKLKVKETSTNVDEINKNQIDELKEETIKSHDTLSPQTLLNRLNVNLPDSTVRMLATGITFVKHCRFGRLKVRFVWLTPDLLNICWRHIGSMQTQKTVPLREFARASIDNVHVKGRESSLILLARKNPKERNLLIEHAIHETIDENKQAAEIWVTSLNQCINRADAVFNEHPSP